MVFISQYFCQEFLTVLKSIFFIWIHNVARFLALWATLILALWYDAVLQGDDCVDDAPSKCFFEIWSYWSGIPTIVLAAMYNISSLEFLINQFPPFCGLTILYFAHEEANTYLVLIELKYLSLTKYYNIIKYSPWLKYLVKQYFCW